MAVAFTTRTLLFFYDLGNAFTQLRRLDDVLGYGLCGAA